MTTSKASPKNPSSRGYGERAVKLPPQTPATSAPKAAPLPPRQPLSITKGTKPATIPPKK